MKKILLVVFLFFTLGMQSQEKYAVLIVGDYAAKLSDISAEALWNGEPHNKHYNSSETSQPEGFVVNQDGNVTITNGEGLAWMISTVNGLNGQESNDYKDVVITLENDIYISGNAWVAIGTQENPFRGTFDGQGFSVQGIDIYDAYEGRNFGLFGYLDNAVIKNVTLGKGQIVGYEDCGGIAYKADTILLSTDAP